MMDTGALNITKVEGGRWQIIIMWNRPDLHKSLLVYRSISYSWCTTVRLFDHGFNQPLDQWDVSNVTAMKHMLDYCGMDTKNYDNTLIGWASQPTMPARHFGAEGITYCNAAAERQKLIDSGWVVKDEGLQCRWFLSFGAPEQMGRYVWAKNRRFFAHTYRPICSLFLWKYYYFQIFMGLI